MPPGGTLGSLIDSSRIRITELKRRAKEFRFRIGDSDVCPPFSSALRRETVAVVAEIKRASPSRGELNSKMDIAQQARAFTDGGASAISVLTEGSRFGGTPDDVPRVREASSLPVLKKDFHIDPVQLLEAKALGASAALLIVRALEPNMLKEMMTSADEIGLELVVEVHTARELDLALAYGARIIGVNSRDLESLTLDAEIPRRLVPRIPRGVIAIAESGIAKPSDVERFAEAGSDAVLVGSSLSVAKDPAAVLRELVNVKRVDGGRPV